MFITQHYTLNYGHTIFMRIYWVHFWEKWESISKRQLQCKEKS